MVERTSYTRLVLGSNPSARTYIRILMHPHSMSDYRPKRTTIKDIIALRKMAPSKRIRALEKKRAEAQAELAKRYKYFHGVRHESASSEIKHSQIKVLEGYVSTLQEEIKSLGKK